MRSPLLAVLLPILSLGAFLWLPGGDIAPAQGCGGAFGNKVCWFTSKAEASWAMPSEDVPTNAWLHFSLSEGDTACSTSGVAGNGGLMEPANLQVELLDAQLVSLGAPEPLSAKQDPHFFIYKWRPSTPLLPGRDYTLRVTGVNGGNAVDLKFHTGTGPFILPELPALEATVSTGYQGNYFSCCEGAGGCGTPVQWCTQLQSVPRLVASVPIGGLPKIPAVIAQDVEPLLEQSEKGGEFVPGVPFSLDWNQVNASFSGSEGPFCLRLRYLSHLDNTSSVSPILCLDTSGLDLSSELLHCNQAIGHTLSCSGKVVTSSETEQFYKDRCENAGGGGQSGAAGGGTAGGGMASAGAVGAGTAGAGAAGGGLATGGTAGGAAGGVEAGGGAAGVLAMSGAAGGGLSGNLSGGGAAGAGGGAAGGGAAGGTAGASPTGQAGAGQGGAAQPAFSVKPANSEACQAVPGPVSTGAIGGVGWLGWLGLTFWRRRPSRRPD